MCSTHLEPYGTDSVGLQRSVIRIVNCWIIEQVLTSLKVIASKNSSAMRHQHICFFVHNIKVVEEQVLQSTECLGWEDRNVLVLI